MNKVRSVATIAGAIVAAALAPASAAAAPTTLSQNTATVITAFNSVSCNSGFHRENHYIRRFDLDGGHGITGAFEITEVTFGIESATGGPQPVDVILSTIPNGSPLTFGNMSPLASETVTVNDADSNSLFDVDISATVSDPTATDLVVDVRTPDGTAGEDSFLIGSNSAGQTAPSYIAAAECGISEPTDLAAIGFPNMHIVMSVTGESQPDLVATPDELDFGTHAVGTISPPETIAVTNAGGDELAVSRVRVLGDHRADFLIAGDDCTGQPVPSGPGEGCDIDIRFAPSAAGLREATLEIASDDPDSPHLLSLEGTGTVPPPDTDPPETTITDHPPALTNDATPTFRFVSDEPGSSFACSLVPTGQPASFSACTSPFAPAIPLGDGGYTFSVRASDALSNTDASPDSFEFTVDATPPIVTITGPAKTKDATPTFAFSFSEEVDRIRCSLDSAQFKPCVDPYTTPKLPLGNHVLRVKAIDDAGNRTTPPAEKSFKVKRR